ncbi:MAG TPA: transcription-repair coupling factor, partial [Chitinophagaceae bacterium]
MNLNELMERYQADSRIFSIADRLTMSQPQQIYLRNLQGSASQLVVSAVFQHPACAQVNHLVVLNDAEEAAYFQNTLENLTQALDLFYFPSSFKNKKNFRLLNSSHVMLRTEALTRLSGGGNKKIIVTYPEALFEKVVLPKTLSANMIRIKSGDLLDVDAMLEQFTKYGFTRTDFVYEPGQFAVRGGILDIYSFGNEKPYRVELFGNEVDSIRIFDPETQLSERKLLQVTIIPNVETQFDSNEKISLLEFLPDNTAVWIQDWDIVKEKILVQEEDLQFFIELQKAPEATVTTTRRQQALADDEDKLEKAVAGADDFNSAAALEQQLLAKHRVEFGRQPSEHTRFEIVFNTKEQPAFNRQFDLLIKDLRNWEAKKYPIYLFAENPKQLERLHSIFADLKADIQFTPIPTSIHEGFIDHDLKVVCYTDHQIFQRYHKYRVRQA